MIQRIQTIFLFLVAVAMGCVLLLPIWHKQGTTQSAQLDAYSLAIYNGPVSDTPASEITGIYVAILAGLSAAVALYSIFQYRNRLTQIKLGALNSLLMGGALLGAWYLSNRGNQLIEGAENGDYLSGFYMPVAALLMNTLANRFIKRDEDLVRSADRLR